MMLGIGIALSEGSSSTFDARTLPGVVLWLRADAGVTLATGVSSWADQSGNGWTAVQATGANQPGLTTSWRNGKPALNYNGTTHNLLINPFVKAQPLTFIIAGQATDSAGNYTLYDGNTNRILVQQLTAPITVRAYAGTLLDVLAIPLNVPFVLSAQYIGGTGTVRLNGVQISTGAVGANSLDQLFVGSAISASSLWKGSLAEFVTYGSLTLAQLQSAERALGVKYGITVA